MKKGLLGSIIGLSSFIVGVLLSNKNKQTYIDKISINNEKNMCIMQMFNQWLKNKNAKSEISDYLHKKGYKHIAIYGISFVGERLYDDLKGTDICVDYAIDNNADNLIYDHLKIIKPSKDMEHVDAIIVTAVYFYDEIEDMLSQITSDTVISLEDVVYEL